jgi:hypothetical protein
VIADAVSAGVQPPAWRCESTERAVCQSSPVTNSRCDSHSALRSCRVHAPNVGLMFSPLDLALVLGLSVFSEVSDLYGYGYGYGTPGFRSDSARIPLGFRSDSARIPSGIYSPSGSVSSFACGR